MGKQFGTDGLYSTKIPGFDMGIGETDIDLSSPKIAMNQGDCRRGIAGLVRFSERKVAVFVS